MKRLLKRDSNDDFFKGWDPLEGELPTRPIYQYEYLEVEDEYAEAEKIIVCARNLIERSMDDGLEGIRDSVKSLSRDAWMLEEWIGGWLPGFQLGLPDFWQLAKRRGGMVDSYTTLFVGLKVDPPNKLRHIVLAAVAIAYARSVLEGLRVALNHTTRGTVKAYLENAQGFLTLAEHQIMEREIEDDRTERTKRARRANRESHKRYDQAIDMARDIAEEMWEQNPALRWKHVAEEIYRTFWDHYQMHGNLEELGLKKVPRLETIKGWIKDQAPPGTIKAGRPPKKGNKLPVR